MRCIAHRGFAETYPENTVTAVRSAFDHVDIVEVDVRRCASGELVVIHDESVDRVTNSTGRVDNHTLSELSALDVLESGDGVPTLDDVLDIVPEDGTLNLELKADVAAAALDCADDAGVNVLLSSFSSETLAKARDAGADRLAFVAADNAEDSLLNVAQSLDCEAVHPHWQLCVDEFVERAHDAELSVNAWTVPSQHDAKALEYVGVDGVIVDRPDVCLE